MLILDNLLIYAIFATMSDIIQLLPDALANQIAAGEVIQRPASAVKELMENAIDAGATSIQLIVKTAGKTLIQIIDNGKGMSETDARVCFEKHATSKIKNIDDLFLVSTKGFRGEALASIAAVAQVELKTRMPDKAIGTKIIIEGSKVISQEPCQTPVGTNVSMKNLFYNVPARRNFLKSDSIEMRHIIDEFERLAIAHTDIFFSLNHNDTDVYHLPKATLRQRIIQIFGKNYDQRLVPVNEVSDIIQVTGFVGKPEYTKRTRGEQYLFVNNRFIKNAYLNHAVMTAFNDLIQREEFPLFVLFVNIQPQMIDVNVHPTKQEIKFEDEKLVYAFVNSGVRHALAQNNLTPSLDFSQDASINNFDSFIKPHFNKFRDEKIETSNQSSIHHSRPMVSVARNNPQNWEELFKTETDRKDQAYKEHSREFSFSHESDHGMEERIGPYQLHQSYIVSPIKSGFILINQQYAHEKILYEKYMGAFSNAPISSQRLLFPITLEFTPGDALLVEAIKEDIQVLGFDIENFGNNTFVIHGLPIEVKEGAAPKVLERIIDDFKVSPTSEKEKIHQFLAKNMAIANAIPMQKKINREEMVYLIEELFACGNYSESLHGKKVFVSFDLDEIGKNF
jgi:DNA mismatch repair protein MutL